MNRFLHETREDRRERRGLKFEVQGSKFRKPRTSDLEPLSFSLVPSVSLGYPVDPGHGMRRSVGFDSSKRAGIRWRTDVKVYPVLSEGGMRRGR